MGVTVEYCVTDAIDALEAEPARSAAFVHLDDAWARPKRNSAFGVEYPTHPFDADAAASVDGEPGVETDLTVVEVLEACHRVLEPGGILAVDVDSYLLPKVLAYFRDEWGQTCYATAQVTALTKKGTPDQSTPGMYFSSGGYTSVLAWRDASPVPEGHRLHEHHCLHCPCQRQREDWGWGTVKPLAPFLQWLDTYTEPGDRILVPCAGTAPAAIAAERLHGNDANVLCIDVEPEAKTAYERRRDDELAHQSRLKTWA